MAEYDIKTPNKESMMIKNIYYNCTECSSLIEIISINEDKGNIQFKCLNKNCINKEKEMSIKEYLKKMLKYKDKTINEDKCQEHSLKKSNEYKTYCLDCNKHLCIDCLKTGNHINHRKNNIIEIAPIKLDLSLFEEVIKEYKNIFEKNQDNINLSNFIKISEIVLNTYDTYNNNYYNALNVINILLCFYQNDYINKKIFGKISNKDYLERLDMKLIQKENINYQIEKEKEKEYEKINEIKAYYENIIIKKNENELNLKDIINKNEEEKKNYEFLLKEYKDIYEKSLENKNKIKELNDKSIPIDLSTAISNSSYLNYNKKFIYDFLSKIFINDNNAKIYFLSKEEEKIFVIEYKLTVTFNLKNYNINLFIHIPVLFPDSPPDFYIEKKPLIGLNSWYKGKIDEKTFNINIDKFCKFKPEINNIEEIINCLNNEFNEVFPIFKDINNKTNGIMGKNTFNKKDINIIIQQINGK